MRARSPRALSMQALADRSTLDDWLASQQAAGRRVALVPTMGALHQGHASLIAIARQHADTVLATVFVNPAQFGPNEDFNSYPRDLDADAAKLAQWGADALFAPDMATLYPLGLDGVRVQPPPSLVARLCGPLRPGHFAGVLTVVLKLLSLTRPAVAVFGQKDYQQFRVIEHMVCDLHVPVNLVCAPIVRSPEGLALSSRNAYLSPAEREAALSLSRSLARVLTAYGDGERNTSNLAHVLRVAWQAQVTAQGTPIELEYLEVLEGLQLASVDVLQGEGVAAIAARIGTARLIDNVVLAPGSPDLALLTLVPPSFAASPRPGVTHG